MPQSDLKSIFQSVSWPGGGAETVSGAGSTRAYTRGLRTKLEDLVRDLGITSIVDAPCGDFNWMSQVDLGDATYMGLDIVDALIARNTARFADERRRFAVADATSDPLPSADLLMCRDLLLHLPYSNIFDLLANIAASDFAWVLISTYVNERNRDLEKAGQARDVNLEIEPFGFVLPPDGRRIPDWVDGFPERYLYLFPGDAFRAQARAILDRVDASRGRPASGAGPATPLDAPPRHHSAYRARFPHLAIDPLIETSRERLGFFSSHAPRMFEYPWMLETLTDLGVTSCADFGAGVSPVPLMLADRGTSVVTVDLSDRIVEVQQGAALTEWGFLDYAALDPRMRSFNQSFETVDFPAPLDAVYSISVIEHVPARIRRRIFAHIGLLLPSGGHFVATLDLKPGSFELWNFDRRKIVDQTGHGTLHDLIDELSVNGLKLAHLQIEAGLPGSGTDVAAVVCRMV
jgi:2-polyprenyl-3-methyl-5-hydroxy-6-metoxy-1,4-benzoquinol methylase